MAFQSHVLENGQWVMRTNNINDLIQTNNSPATSSQTARETPPGPQCGIMTRTVVQSPVAHWVLSVRLRASQHNDVAFVGDHYVQISELRRDGQLHTISRKCDFGSRIRNAKVIGSSRFMVKGKEHSTTEPAVDNDEMTDFDSFIPTPTSSQSNLAPLPPQLLLIVLETGDCIFLFLRPTRDDDFEFVALQHRVHGSRLVRPGFHMAVDPSSRFVAQACARNMFVVHAIESMNRLSDSYARGLPLRPVLSSRPRTVNGIIHTMEFLFPRPEDPKHVILLLIVVKDGVSRMITYDWELGDDLKRVLAEEKNGHTLPPEHEMPLMIIPLTVRSAFFAVSEGEIACCADLLHGSPSFESCRVHDAPPSKHHDGKYPPLWTAWSRPPRLFSFHRDKDFIYLAREDGVVIYLECDSSDDVLGASFYHGTFCNVSTAFASLADEFDDGEGLANGESLVFGGDSGQGGVWRASRLSSDKREHITDSWQASPRKVITKLCRIPNWSPTVDFVTTAESSRWDDIDGATGRTARPQRSEGMPNEPPTFSKPDKIYAAAGRASNGSIVEFRHGLQANIGIEFDFGTVVKRCFMFKENSLDPASGYHLLLSVAGRSALLYFDSRFSATSARELGQGDTPYDLSRPTLIAKPIYEGITLQVSEGSIVFVTASHSAEKHLTEFNLGHDAVVTDAAVEGNDLVIITHTTEGFQLHAIKLDILKFEAEFLYSEPFTEGEVTCFSLHQLSGKTHAVACLWWEKAVYLDFYCVTDRRRAGTISLKDLAATTEETEPFTSILLDLDESTGRILLVAGSRDGVLVTVCLPTFSTVEVGSASFERIGSMPAHVYPAQKGGSAFVSCDSDFVLLSDFRKGLGFAQKRNVWTVDAEDGSKPSPVVTFATVLPKSLSGNEANIPLLLLATDHILLAELQPHAGPVQRHIPLGMTPSKLLYSHVLKCLVVAARTPDNETTLRFIDPDSGEDLSLPVHSDTQSSVDFISGLGKKKDQILGLEEWHLRLDSGHGHYYILVSTRGVEEEGSAAEGRVLVVSVVTEQPHRGQGPRKIRFWTRNKLKKAAKDLPGPITAVAASGNRIHSSMGSNMLYHQLDMASKKLVAKSSQGLGSPAWKLSILPGGSRTLALVKGDGVRVLEEGDGQEGLIITHVERTTRPAMDMLEVCGAWDEATPIVSEPPASIILVSDQNCGVKGTWIPWDSPGKDCDVALETDLPSSVRRLRLGRTLPVWSRGMRAEKRFGRLPASVDDAEILGMGIDGSLQHFTLLDLNVWRILRLVQNISETSPELYPFTYVPFEEVEGGDDGAGGFDPTPIVDRGLEMQVDGDLMQRCLEKRALEDLLGKREEWMRLFVQYLDRVDGGRWTKGFRDREEDVVMDSDDRSERKEWYFDLAYEIMEYFLVPVI